MKATMQEEFDKIKITPNCTCMGCSFYKRVNNITTLGQLLKARDDYREIRKSIMGHRMNQARVIIESKLAKIKI